MASGPERSARAARAKDAHASRVLDKSSAILMLVAEPNVVVVDVDTDICTAAWDCASRVHAPLEGLVEGLTNTPPFGSQWPSKGMKYFPISAESTLLLVCTDGERSLVALDVLDGKYEKVYAVDGGVAAWDADDLPTESVY